MRLYRRDPAARAEARHAANAADPTMRDYLPRGPFAPRAAYRDGMGQAARDEIPVFHAILPHATGRAGNVASHLRIAPEAGSIWAGRIAFFTRLQRRVAAAEAMAMGWALEAGYRRHGWKRDALHIALRRAAQRLGLCFEGVFRQAAVAKGRDRETGWFAVIDREWPALKAAFENWRTPDNFDAEGRQIPHPGDLTAPVRAAPDRALES